MSVASDAGARSQVRPSVLVQTMPRSCPTACSMQPRPTATKPGPPAVTASIGTTGRPADDGHVAWVQV